MQTFANANIIMHALSASTDKMKTKKIEIIYRSFRLFGNWNAYNNDVRF